MKLSRSDFLVKLSLLFLSVILAMAFFEIALRVVCPKYKYAAGAQVRVDKFRIYKNIKNTKEYRQRPDSKERYLVIHNSLGFRQHGEFSKNKPEGIIRIGFFGDSFTENLRIASQYSFTEPLDYLLNKTGSKYEVMNFGTDGYGADQAYL